MEPVKRRALVLTDEAARHPFRASLPRHCRLPLVETGRMDGDGGATLAAPLPRPWRAAAADLRWFAGVYGAGVLATFAFIA